MKGSKVVEPGANFAELEDHAIAPLNAASFRFAFGEYFANLSGAFATHAVLGDALIPVHDGSSRTSIVPKVRTTPSDSAAGGAKAIASTVGPFVTPPSTSVCLAGGSMDGVEGSPPQLQQAAGRTTGIGPEGIQGNTAPPPEQQQPRQRRRPPPPPPPQQPPPPQLFQQQQQKMVALPRQQGSVLAHEHERIDWEDGEQMASVACSGVQDRVKDSEALTCARTDGATPRSMRERRRRAFPCPPPQQIASSPHSDRASAPATSGNATCEPFSTDLPLLRTIDAAKEEQLLNLDHAFGDNFSVVDETLVQRREANAASCEKWEREHQFRRKLLIAVYEVVKEEEGQ